MLSRIQLLQYNARGEPTRPEASPTTWNFVSIKVPEVMDFFSASSKNCGGTILVIVQDQISAW